LSKLIVETRGYLILLLGVLTVVTWSLYLGSRPVSGSSSPMRVMIPNGVSADKIGGILKRAGLVRSPLVFSITCRLSGSAGKLKPGVYEFSPSMNLPQVVRKLVQGDSLEQWVTIPEGFTVRQIADLLESTQLAGGDAFTRLAIDQGHLFARFDFIEGRNLEGYLFPDTYLIARGTDSEQIVRRMLTTFERKVALPLRSDIERVARGRFGLPRDRFPEGLRRVLTLASIVEREARIAKDRPLIAAVLWNRLKKSMRLEVDATVSYIPGQSRDNKDKVYYSDLDSSSAYNTYRIDGLPPGPICNPGLAAIKAVLYPAQVDYLYYVAQPDGSHIFSRTFEEHQAARKAARNGNP